MDANAFAPVTIVMAKNDDTAVTIRIQRCTCALSAQLPPSTVNVAVMAKARMRATASQPWYHIYHLYTCIPVYLYTCISVLLLLLLLLLLAIPVLAYMYTYTPVYRTAVHVSVRIPVQLYMYPYVYQYMYHTCTKTQA